MKKLLIGAVLLAGCSSTGVDRNDQNSIIREFYANVTSMKEVELSSEVGVGIASGAIVGVLDEADGNSEDMIAGGIAGAFIGGLFTALFEGGNTAYQYQLTSQYEGSFALVQKEQVDTQSGCVKVKVANQVTVSPAPSHMCDSV